MVGHGSGVVALHACRSSHRHIIYQRLHDSMCLWFPWYSSKCLFHSCMKLGDGRSGHAEGLLPTWNIVSDDNI